MITRQLKLEIFQKILVQQSKHLKNSCSFFRGYHVLDETPKPPLVSVHRFMLNLLHQNRQGEALDVFRKNLEVGLSGVDEVAIAIASKACLGRPRLGSQIHGLAIVSGFMSYVSVCNSLMNMYCKSRELRKALCIFENMKTPDTVSYNTVLSGFEDSKCALLFAREMHSVGVVFDAVTYTSVLAHCADGQEFDFGFQLHCLVLKFGLKMEIFIGNALVTLYSKCGKITDADKVFREMPHKDLVSWNAILSGYAQEACGQERNLDFGKQVYALSMKSGYGSHVSVCNVLMSMYSKCEMVEDAELVFENIIDHNVVSWTTMLSINEEDAVNLFKEMMRHEIYPMMLRSSD
ncbi:UNVERIFIED_CONTAM: Pentatricopeptide repeat-containing protein, mitochondrial [Sesamum radiatum]|uniref:Pentatricopeptide repeat-containing protein, mitochondrial n=1 Tax=Sesamum radiatum TaxID=300843 RepID=A0AAW2S6Y5_SESRA